MILKIFGIREKMFLSVADQHAPPKTKRVRQKASPWLTRDITALIIKGDRAKSNAQKRNDSNLWLEYKSLRNQVNKEIKNAKKYF